MLGLICLKPRALPKVGLSSESAEGWVKVNDVLTSDYFKDMTKEILMKVLGSVIFGGWAVGSVAAWERSGPGMLAGLGSA
jgi:hypothetical protein